MREASTPIIAGPLANGAPPTPPARRARRRRRRWLALAAVLVALVAGAASYYAVARREVAPRYRFARVERGPVTAAVSATGNLNAVTTVLVGSQVSGKIQSLSADFNTVVTTGQVIAQIDPALFEATVAQARADVAAARGTVANQQAQVAHARTAVETARAALAEARAQTVRAEVTVVDTGRTLARQTRLYEQALVAAAERDAAEAARDVAVAAREAAAAHERALASAVETAEAQHRAAEAALDTARRQVEQKQAALAHAEVNLDHTTIRSPVDGVVVNRAVDVGQTVAATLQAPTLFTIARDLTKMQVEASVDEADIARIRGETPVTFTVDAFRGRTFTGRVAQIRKAPQIVQNVVTYTVVVAVDNPRGELLPGMTANATFVTARRGDALKVPNTALRFRPATAAAADGARVWVLGRDGTPAPVAVVAGITDGAWTEVSAGTLAEGQEVLVGVEETPVTPAPPMGPGLRFRF
jgi:HlyD family secretion protein